jgi:hypothetical protein
MTKTGWWSMLRRSIDRWTDGTEENVNVAELFVALVEARDRQTQLNPDTWQWPPGAVNIEFHPPTSEGDSGRYEDGTVRIFRRDCSSWDGSLSAVELARASSCPLEELITFVHELGHHDARRFGLPCLRDGTAKEYESEVWAWEIGRAILAATAFTDWLAFETRSCADLGTYRAGLSLGKEEADGIEARVRCEVPNIITAAVP